MTFLKDDIIRYRLEKSKITFNETESLANNGFWNGAANRLYYSCFYLVIALLAKDDFPSSTHNGIRPSFSEDILKRGFSEEISAHYILI